MRTCDIAFMINNSTIIAKEKLVRSIHKSFTKRNIFISTLPKSTWFDVYQNPIQLNIWNINLTALFLKIRVFLKNFLIIISLLFLMKLLSNLPFVYQVNVLKEMK